MKKSYTEILNSFSQLMVYTIEFKQNATSELYTIDKLTDDYEKLIDKAKADFEQKRTEVDFEDALFPFATWIDEVILSSDFKDKKQWRKNLLQKKFFNTSNAGYEFYDELSRIDKNAYDLRMLYLYCLFLGFKGRYYKDEDIDTLSSIFEREKKLTGDSFSKEFPQLAFRDAYAQQAPQKKKNFKPSYKRVWIVVGVSLVLGLVLYLAQQAHLNGLLEKYNIF